MKQMLNEHCYILWQCVLFYVGFEWTCVLAKINEVDGGEEGDDNITFDDVDVEDDDIDEVGSHFYCENVFSSAHYVEVLYFI